jgi:hypothetical protein
MPAFWAERTPRERKLMIVFVAFAVIFAAFKLMSGGGSGPVAAEGGTPHTATDATAPQSPTGTPDGVVDDGSAVIQVKHPVLTGSKRDPFAPLVVVAEDGAAGGGEPGAEAEGEAEEKKIAVGLVDIYDEAGHRYADVMVDGQLYTVEVGDDITERFSVYFLSKRCGTFLDGSTRFALCVGQTLEF